MEYTELNEMNTLVMEGIYEDGKIKLEELPVGVVRARVRVSFFPYTDTPEEPADREAARQRALARMRAGINFGGERFNREEIYSERIRELEPRQNKQP